MKNFYEQQLKLRIDSKLKYFELFEKILSKQKEKLSMLDTQERLKIK